MSKTELLEQIVQKQDELIILLDEMNFDTNPEKLQWRKRRRMFKELASLRQQLEKAQETDAKTCIHKDGVGICYNGNTDYYQCPGSCSEAEYPVNK